MICRGRLPGRGPTCWCWRVAFADPWPRRQVHLISNGRDADQTSKGEDGHDYRNWTWLRWNVCISINVRGDRREGGIGGDVEIGSAGVLMTDYEVKPYSLASLL